MPSLRSIDGPEPGRDGGESFNHNELRGQTGPEPGQGHQAQSFSMLRGLEKHKQMEKSIDRKRRGE